MQIFRNTLSAWAFSVDKNRRRVDVCSEREKERDRKLSPLPSLLPTISSLLFSLPPLFRGNRWTFTRQRSAFRCCAAIIVYCERKLSLGQTFRMAVGHRSHNKRRSLARKWRWLFNADTSSVANHDAFSRRYTTRFIVYSISLIVSQIFSKAFVQCLDVAQIVQVCATYIQRRRLIKRTINATSHFSQTTNDEAKWDPTRKEFKKHNFTLAIPINVGMYNASFVN